MRLLTKLALAMAFASAATASAYASAPFDGTWSVQLTTQKGRCDPTYSWSVAVTDGRIDNDGMFLQAAGSIDHHGRVRLQVTHGADVLAATGAARGRYASGAWRSPTMRCSGAWRAARS